jgi:hypothetical protein
LADGSVVPLLLPHTNLSHSIPTGSKRSHSKRFVILCNSVLKRTRGDFIMVGQHSKKKNVTASKTKITPEQKQGATPPKKHSAMEIDESASRSGADIKLEGKRMGGPTGGDISGGGKKHRVDNSTADHYGSREETNAALEDKIAIQNTLKLHEHF